MCSSQEQEVDGIGDGNNSRLRSSQRGTCARCGRSFNLTRGGEIRKHKCNAAAPLALEAEASGHGRNEAPLEVGASAKQEMNTRHVAPTLGTLGQNPASFSFVGLHSPMAQPIQGDDQRRVWQNIRLSLLRVFRDGLPAAFLVWVRTNAQLAGLRLADAVQRESRFPPSTCGKVLSACTELAEVHEGSVVIGIGDSVLLQPPLEHVPLTGSATAWLRDRLHAYKSVGWDRVPVLCHGPVPVSIRHALKSIERKLADGTPLEQRLTRDESLLVQRTLMTVTDRDLAAFESSLRAEQLRLAQNRRMSVIEQWRSLPRSFVEAGDEYIDDNEVSSARKKRAQDGVQDLIQAIEKAANTGWLSTPSCPNGPPSVHSLDVLCRLRAASKTVARALYFHLRELCASDFRRDILDPIYAIRLATAEGSTDRRVYLSMARGHARRYVADKNGPPESSSFVFSGIPSADRFYDFISRRYGNLTSLELPMLPGTTELGIRVRPSIYDGLPTDYAQAIASALGPKLHALKLVNWHWTDLNAYPSRDEQQFDGLAGGECGCLDTLTLECENLRELVIHAVANPNLPPAPRAWFEQRLGCLRILDVGRIAFDAPLRVAELPHLVDLACAHLPDLRQGSTASKTAAVYYPPSRSSARVEPAGVQTQPPTATKLYIYDSAYADATVRDWALASQGSAFAKELSHLSIVADRGACLPGSAALYAYADDAIRAICVAFPELTRLELHGSVATFQPDTMAAIRRLKLEHLSLVDSSFIPAGCLSHFPRTIETLDLSGCTSLLQRAPNENVGQVSPGALAQRFNSELVALLQRACPGARLRAHIEIPQRNVLCTLFREQCLHVNDHICPRCFWRVGGSRTVV